MSQTPNMSHGNALFLIVVLSAATVACLISGPGMTNRLEQAAYWACVTATPIPTEVYLAGTMTPPAVSTGTPVSTGEPIWGYTTPVPTETPYYRTGSFYPSQKVYVNGIEFEFLGHSAQPAPNPDLTYTYFHFDVTNYHEDGDVVPLSQLLFVREVAANGETMTGRWVNANHVLLAAGYPVIEEAEQVPMDEGETRHYTIGLSLPNGEIVALGLATDWPRPVEGGVPIWFHLENDPVECPYGSAQLPPPPTPAVVGDSYGSSGLAGAVWPANGYLTGGFGCRPTITGIISPSCPPGYEFHNGLDIANNTGTVVVSPVTGLVVHAGPAASGPDCAALPGSNPPHLGFGNYVQISGANGQVHALAHLQTVTVSTGQNVAAGQAIGTMNSTGCSSGSHLHWGCYVASMPVDPATC